MGRKKMRLSRILAVLLALVLVIGLFPTAALAVEDNFEPDSEFTLSEVDLSKLDISKIQEQLLNKKGVDAKSVLTQASSKNEESAYVETVAKMLTEQIGVYGLDDIGDNETANVFVWLQELPDALERIYKTEQMNVPGYFSASSDADLARSTIRALGGGGMSRSVPVLNVNYEYFEVFSGFAIEASKSVIETLAELPGVYLITEVGYNQMDDYTLDPTYTTPGNAGAREIFDMGSIHAAGYTGANVNVGVIDSGIDATHPDLVGAFKAGWNFTSDRYTGKSSNMSRPDGDHGTHVSGTIASQGVYSLGMAPGVNLYMAQVFTADNTNSASSSDILAAIEAFTTGDAAKGFPKMDVVNMSLGAPVDTAYDAESFAINNGVIAGVSFVTSAGNNAYPDTDTTQRNAYSLGSPSTTSLAVTVAASQYGGNQLDTYNATVSNGSDSGTISIAAENGDHTLSGVYQDGSFGGGANPPVYVPGLGYELYYACSSAGEMTANEMTALSALPAGSLAGKILVVNRGQNFADYKTQATRTGASGLIILNRAEVFIGNLNIGSETASADMVIFSGKQSAKQTLLDLTAGGAIAYLDPGQIILQQLTKEPTGFSSVGPVTETAEIKPDVIAPGYNVLSTSVEVNYPAANESTYVEMGGTSMSSPCVAGIMALLKQKYPTETPIQLKARLMNTADPNVIKPNTSNMSSSGAAYNNPYATETSVFEQGAGFVNPYRAIMGDNVYITVDNVIPTGGTDKATMASTLSSFSFGNAEPGSATRELTATVTGAADYGVSVQYNNNTRYSRSSEGVITVNYEINGNTFNVWLDISESASTDPIEGNLYEGYIVVTANGGNYVLPWAVRVGEAPDVSSDDWLLFPTRPIQATYNHANQEWSQYSSQNYLYFMFDGDDIADSVVLRRSGNTYYMDILLFNVNNTAVPAYRYQVGLASSTNPNLTLSDIIYADGRVYQVQTAARAYARNANGTWATGPSSIAAGSYYIGLEFREDTTSTYYNYYLQLGVTFSNTRPTLTINNASTDAAGTELGDVTLSANSSTYGIYDYKASAYTVSGSIYSSAIAEASTAGLTGFYWAGYYLLNYGVIIPLDQSLNVLEDGSLGGYFVTDDAGNPWICDGNGNFSMTLDTPADKNNAYLLNYNTNASTGEIEWTPSGSRHNLIAVDAFDVTQATSTQYATIANLTAFTWTPYVREGDPVIVAVEATAGGTASLTGDGTGMYAPGEPITATAAPEAGYYFMGWYADGFLVSLDNPYGFAATGNLTLQARFASVVDENATASVEKLNGNKNNLTITVTELLSDGSTKVYTQIFSISNNAAGTYVVTSPVASYKVYVDTKGNTQVRECYIVK